MWIQLLNYLLLEESVMKPKYFATALVSAALIAGHVQTASADAGDFIGGAIIGGLIGSQIQKNNQRRRTTTTYRSTRQRIPATQEGRQIQTSLNYFGFNAGRVDGQLGRQSKSAVSSYQAHMGYPATGNLTVWEKDFLLNSYDRAQAGGAATMQLIAANPQGPRGLLHVYRNQMAGTAQPTVPVAVPNTVVTTVPAQTGTVVTVAPAPAQEQAQAPVATFASTESDDGALPNFLGSSQSVSLASHCNGVSLLTNTNGGFTTVSNMTDPHFALNEQFCLARTYAIKQGEDMTAKLANVSPGQISSQCAAFGPAMKDQIAALSLQSRDDVVRATSNFILSTGMSPADLSGTAKICLSSGYRTDELDVAIASSLMLVALGEQVYAALLGHHLSQGFGVSKRPDLARSWYQMSTDALDNGSTAVFAPGQPERAGLLKQAALSLSGGASSPENNPQPVSTLPSFGSGSN